MKELKPVEDIYLEEYDVYVHPYLTLDNIDKIVKGICAVEAKEYVDRKMNEDALVLYYGTTLEREEIEGKDYEELQQSGLIQAVRDNIKNIDRIADCLNYMESFNRAFLMLSPKILPLFEKIGEMQNAKNKDNK